MLAGLLPYQNVNNYIVLVLCVNRGIFCRVSIILFQTESKEVRWSFRDMNRARSDAQEKLLLLSIICVSNI